MNKVVTINLGGTAYQLEEGGYDTLRSYLETAAARLQGNPDRDEILSDIEWAIAEKFRALLNSHKTVVVTKEVAAVLAAMGPIEAGAGEATAAGTSSAGTGAASGPSGPGAAKAEPTRDGNLRPKRLYRIREGDMVAGVCNGLAAYCHLDPTLIRLAFAFLTLLWGMGLLVYIIMAIVVPEARTPEEKAAATGDPSTAQEFIRRAKEGYYEAIKGFPDRQARREWKRRFKQNMRANACQWQQNWHCHWGRSAPMPPGVPMPPGTGFALPFLSVLHGAVKILWVCALVSLLATGAVFGVALPASLPVWAGALLLFFIYGSFTWPLKAGRRACYWSLGQASPAWSLIFLVDAIIWIAVVAILFWLAMRHSSELYHAIESLPILAHQAMDAMQTWWNKN